MVDLQLTGTGIGILAAIAALLLWGDDALSRIEDLLAGPGDAIGGAIDDATQTIDRTIDQTTDILDPRPEIDRARSTLEHAAAVQIEGLHGDRLTRLRRKDLELRAATHAAEGVTEIQPLIGIFGAGPEDLRRRQQEAHQEFLELAQQTARERHIRERDHVPIGPLTPEQLAELRSDRSITAITREKTGSPFTTSTAGRV